MHWSFFSLEAPMSLYPLETSFQEHQLSHVRPDALLAKQVLSGDTSAFEFLVERYNAPLFNFICRFLGDYDLACDVLQTVFLRLYTYLPNLDTGEPFRSWLFHVARNCCVDELRRKQRSPLHFSQLEEREGELDGLSDIPHPGPLPEEVVERRDLQSQLQEAILALPPKFRSVVILRYSSQMSFPEIGKILNMPEATAKTYFHRAKALLRKTLVARLQMERS
jgi:RNA polymerase sigma factor (sigma-70 family)